MVEWILLDNRWFRCVRMSKREVCRPQNVGFVQLGFARVLELREECRIAARRCTLGGGNSCSPWYAQPLSGPITVGGKLHLTQEQWEACQGDGKKGEFSPSTGGRKRGKLRKARKGAQTEA
jgi:hypothetical protein